MKNVRLCWKNEERTFLEIGKICTSNSFSQAEKPINKYLPKVQLNFTQKKRKLLKKLDSQCFSTTKPI